MIPAENKCSAIISLHLLLKIKVKFFLWSALWSMTLALPVKPWCLGLIATLQHCDPCKIFAPQYSFLWDCFLNKKRWIEGHRPPVHFVLCSSLECFILSSSSFISSPLFPWLVFLSSVLEIFYFFSLSRVVETRTSWSRWREVFSSKVAQVPFISLPGLILKQLNISLHVSGTASLCNSVLMARFHNSTVSTKLHSFRANSVYE